MFLGQASGWGVGVREPAASSGGLGSTQQTELRLGLILPKSPSPDHRGSFTSPFTWSSATQLFEIVTSM